jgi:hypothetical protein
MAIATFCTIAMPSSQARTTFCSSPPLLGSSSVGEVASAVENASVAYSGTTAAPFQPVVLYPVDKDPHWLLLADFNGVLPANATEVARGNVDGTFQGAVAFLGLPWTAQPVMLSPEEARLRCTAERRAEPF